MYNYANKSLLTFTSTKHILYIFLYNLKHVFGYNLHQWLLYNGYLSNNTIARLFLAGIVATCLLLLSTTVPQVKGGEIRRV